MLGVCVLIGLFKQISLLYTGQKFILTHNIIGLMLTSRLQ